MQRTALAGICLAIGCSTTHGIRPIGAGNVGVELSLGGPITEVFGAPIPIPLTTAGVTFGATATTDIHAAFHPTAALMFGIGAGEVGASQQLVAPENARPRVMADLTIIGAAGDLDPDRAPEGGFRVFVQPTLLAGWDYGKGGEHTAYTGVTGFVEPGEEFSGIAGLILGNRFGVGRSHVDLELKWLDPWESAVPIVPVYYSPGSLGAVEFQVAYGFTFDGGGE